MKYGFLLLSSLLIFSCSNSAADESETATSPSATNEPVAAETPQVKEPLGDACKIPASEIAEIMGWDDYLDAMSNSMNGEKYQACDYATNLSGTLTILLTRHDDSNPDGRYLERAFEQALANEGKDMKWQAASGFGDEVIYGFGKTGPNYSYKLRWRFGNHTEHSLLLRAPKERNAEETLNQLKEIAAKV